MDFNIINEKSKLILSLEDGPEKIKAVEEFNILFNKYDKEKKEEELKIKNQKEKEIRQKEENIENIKLQKYKALFEKRMKAFDYGCPQCGSLCNYRNITMGQGKYAHNFPALFCTNGGCSESKQYGSYDCDDKIGIDKERCVKKIFFN